MPLPAVVGQVRHKQNKSGPLGQTGKALITRQWTSYVAATQFGMVNPGGANAPGAEAAPFTCAQPAIIVASTPIEILFCCSVSILVRNSLVLSSTDY